MNILSSINEFEVEVIRERIKDVKRNKKENGEVYGRMMYGYDNVNGKMIENKEEIIIIIRVKNNTSIEVKGSPTAKLIKTLMKIHICILQLMHWVYFIFHSFVENSGLFKHYVYFYFLITNKKNH